MKSILVFFILVIQLLGANKNFDLYKKRGEIKGHTLLIIGGIHGDEPWIFCTCIFREIL
ncbi:MAG: hypothetical protein U5K55_15395 [Aliarcobacter sp.]|nr:hypothetical protein [Aliarcobacter sp.]